MEKTWTYREMELREQMAQEIEKNFNDEEIRDDFDQMWRNGMKYAAEIVRGGK